MHRMPGFYGIFDTQDGAWTLDCFDDPRDFYTLEQANFYKRTAYPFPRYQVRIMANPARIADWISDVWSCKRVCKLLSFTCVADFDITPESIAPLAIQILDAMVGPEIELCRCETLNIGLYDGGKDIRVWIVNPV
jgi:hypothetical protein